MLEVGMGLSKEGMAKPLILIAEDQASIPFDLAGHIVIRRPRSIDDESAGFIRSIESAFADAFSRISPTLEDEPSRLIAKKEYRAAVIAAFSLLEHELRQFFEAAGPESFSARSNMMMLLDYARSKEVLTPKEFELIRQHVFVRNRIVHTRSEVAAAQAKTIVRDVSAATAKIREANLTRRSSGPTTA
jgi:hypothetical protein